MFSRFGASFLLLALPTLSTSPLSGQAPPAASQNATQESSDELLLTVGKSLVVSSTVPVERVAVGFGDIAEAAAVGPREVLLHGKAPGETSLIVWQKGGNKLVFDVNVRANIAPLQARIGAVRRALKRELPDQNINIEYDNDTVFLRGTARDVISADRAQAIAGTLGKTVNLLYVDIPAVQQQILLKVRFASLDRNNLSELGANLFSLGAAGNIGRITTQEFSPPQIARDADGKVVATISDALNIFLFRPDLNLGATIRALQQRSILEILAEPNVLALNGRQASFLAGGEYPYPTLQGGGAGLGAVTIQFREFGIRINFVPTITPRDTILLDVAPEVSALDFTNGLVFQGFNIPALTVRRVHTQVELSPGQSFAIGGLLDRRTIQQLEKIPIMSEIPILGKLFQSKSTTKQNSELLVVVTPELVRPIPQNQPVPSLEYPLPFMGSDKTPRTPGIEVTGNEQPKPAHAAIPLEQLLQSQRESETSLKSGTAASGLPNTTWQPQQQTPYLVPLLPQPASRQ